TTTATTQPIPGIQSLVMITNTAETRCSSSNCPCPALNLPVMNKMLMPGLLMAAALSVQASTALGPWVPVFKGIDHAVGTNTPGGGGMRNLQVVHSLRIDLTDRDIQLFSTPRISNYSADFRETGGLTVSDFLVANGLQVAIN